MSRLPILSSATTASAIGDAHLDPDDRFVGRPCARWLGGIRARYPDLGSPTLELAI